MDLSAESMDLDQPPEPATDGPVTKTQVEPTVRVKFKFLVDLRPLPRLGPEDTGQVPVSDEALLEKIRQAAWIICCELQKAKAGPSMVSSMLWKPNEEDKEAWELEESVFQGWTVTVCGFPVGVAQCNIQTVRKAVCPNTSFVRFKVALAYPLYATEETFKMIEHGAHVLRSQDFIHFDEDSEYHVAVGNGPEGLDGSMERRLFTLLWLGGGRILHSVHPPHRSLHTDEMFCTEVDIAEKKETKKYLESLCNDPNIRFWGTDGLQWMQACGLGLDKWVNDSGGVDLSGWLASKSDQTSLKVEKEIMHIWTCPYEGFLDECSRPSDAYCAPSDDYMVCQAIQIARPVGHVKWAIEPENEKIEHSIEFFQGDGDLRRDNDEAYPVMWAKVAVGLFLWAAFYEDDQATEQPRTIADEKTKANIRAFGNTIQEATAAARLGSGHEREMVERLLKSVKLPDDVVAYMVDRAERMKAE